MEWLKSLDILGPRETFQSFPETGSNEISSHMNWEVATCAMGFLSQQDTQGGWGGERREVVTLPLILSSVFLRL